MTVLVWAAPLALTLTKEERLLLWVSVLVGVLLLGAVVIARLDRWRKRQMEEAVDYDDAAQQAGTFRAMYERGELSKEEYDRVLRRVAERVGISPKPVPATTAAPPATQPPATQEPPTPPA
jgi:hypothetical protein